MSISKREIVAFVLTLIGMVCMGALGIWLYETPWFWFGSVIITLLLGYVLGHFVATERLRRIKEWD